VPYGFDAATEITGPDQAFMVIAYSVLQCVAVCCSVWQCVALGSSVVQCVAIA